MSGLARMLRSSVASTPVKTGNVSSVAHSTPVRSRFQSGDHELLPHAGKKPWEKPWERPSSVWYSSLQCRYVVWWRCIFLSSHLRECSSGILAAQDLQGSSSKFWALDWKSPLCLHTHRALSAILKAYWLTFRETTAMAGEFCTSGQA